MARGRIWYAALIIGMIAACEPASSPSQDTKVNQSPWQHPGAISGYVLQAGEVQSQPSRFLSENSWFTAVEATEREYTYIHPETKESVDILVIQHARPKWAVQEFAGLAVRLKTETVKGKVVLSDVGTQEVLNVSGVSPGAWRRYVAWPTLPYQTVVVAASHSKEPELKPFVLAWLTGYPARPFKHVVERSRRALLLDEIGRCLDLMADPNNRGIATGRIGELTFFLPEGRRELQADISAGMAKEFPAWWDKNRDRPQAEWLRERVGKEVQNVTTYVQEGSTRPAQASSALLKVLTGYSVPPWTVQETSDLKVLGASWRRFWEGASEKPRELWGREVVDIWLDYVDGLLASRGSPTGIWSSLTDLTQILNRSDPKPEALPRLPVAPVAFTDEYGREIVGVLGTIRRWWSENRPRVRWASGGSVLFEEGPEIRLDRE